MWEVDLPVNSGALYAEGDAQVDAGPAGIWLAAVTAAAVSWDSEDLLQGALPLQRPLLGLTARVQASCRCGRLPVQLLWRRIGCTEEQWLFGISFHGNLIHVVPDRDRRAVRYLTVVSLVAEGRSDAVLHGLDPGLSQLLRVGLHHAAPVGRHVWVTQGGGTATPTRPRFRDTFWLLLGRRNHFETEAALDVLTVFDCAQSQILHHHGRVVLRRKGRGALFCFTQNTSFSFKYFHTFTDLSINTNLWAQNTCKQSKKLVLRSKRSQVVVFCQISVKTSTYKL